VTYAKSALTAGELYEAFEPLLNAGEVELPDLPVLQEQLLTLVRRGSRVSHEAGGHDDWANACAGAVQATKSGLSWYSSLAWVGSRPRPSRLPGSNPWFYG
jgi:hypothetical protein